MLMREMKSSSQPLMFASLQHCWLLASPSCSLMLYCDVVGIVNANCSVATKVCCVPDALAAALFFLVLHPDCLNFCFGYS